MLSNGELHPNLKLRDKARMEYGKLEYNKLLFLSEYGFRIQNNSNGKYIEIACIKNDFCIIYHEWFQFGDFNIFIVKSMDEYKNHIFQRVYGLKWLVDNVLPKYKQATARKKASKIELVEFYLREQINNQESAFGVLLN